MSSPLTNIRKRVDRAIRRYPHPSLQLVKVIEAGNDPVPPDVPNTTTYIVTGRLTGGGQYVEGEEVVTFDLMLVMMTRGVPIEFIDDGLIPVVPEMKDYFIIFGQKKIIKRIEEIPQGDPTRYRVYLQSS